MAFHSTLNLRPQTSYVSVPSRRIGRHQVRGVATQPSKLIRVLCHAARPLAKTEKRLLEISPGHRGEVLGQKKLLELSPGNPIMVLSPLHIPPDPGKSLQLDLHNIGPVCIWDSSGCQQIIHFCQPLLRTRGSLCPFETGRVESPECVDCPSRWWWWRHPCILHLSLLDLNQSSQKVLGPGSRPP